MPEIIFNGPVGRLQGRYKHSKTPNAPLAILLHPSPKHGGTMNNKIVYTMFQTFAQRGFSTMRFNFRGVGRSQGEFDNGDGELSDAASALDWMQQMNPEAPYCWVGGFAFGAWIGMQLLMRRPEIKGFVSVAPPANIYDFTFLAPCPQSGLIVHGDQDRVICNESIDKLVQRLHAQQGIEVDHRVIKGANHFFTDGTDNLVGTMHEHLNYREAGPYKIDSTLFHKVA